MNKKLVCRCPWCEGDDVYTRYHDKEWGVPLHNSRKLFEFLVLHGAQAGLSWITILKRRDLYRASFDNFDAEKMARYGARDIKRLLSDKSPIIKNKLKVESAINNAKCYLEFKEKGISFSSWLWDFVDGKPIINNYKTMKDVPAKTALSEKVSKELKDRGFTFVGPIIVYAFMQAAGFVNDHLTSCFRHDELL